MIPLFAFDMTFDAGALAAFALTVLTGIVWLIWQASATHAKVDSTQKELTSHRLDFQKHLECDKNMDTKIMGLLTEQHGRLMVLEDRKSRD